MSFGWPETSIGDVCTPAERWETPTPGVEYRQIGVRLWGEGAYEREPLDGGGTKYRLLNRVEPGDIIVNKIWARNGSVSVVDEHLAGCCCSGEFPLFHPLNGRLEPRWFYWITKTRWFWDRCDTQSRGTSGKNRIRPEKFLQIPIPLPPLPEQRQIVAKVEELAAKIEEARGLRWKSGQETNSIVSSELRYAFTNLEKRYGLQQLESVLTDACYGTSVKCHSDRADNAIPVLRIPNVAAEKVDLADLKYGVLPDREAEKASLNEGDILIVRTNGSASLVGRCAVVPPLPKSHAFASYLIRLRCDRAHVEPDYLQLALRHLRSSGQLFDFARTTAGQYNVSIGRLNAASFPVAPKAEQRQLVATIDDLQAKVDSLKALQAKTAAELDALLPSVLDKAFKGEL